MQEELNKNMQKAKEQMKKEGNKPENRPAGTEHEEQLAKMAAQQEYIRNELQNLILRKIKTARIPYNLQTRPTVWKKPKRTSNRMISEETLKRQQDHPTRLLEMRKERERDQDEQRKPRK